MGFKFVKEENNVNTIKTPSQQSSTNIKANINDIITYVNKNNARSIWGAVVTLLHRNNLMALYTACGELKDIALENNELIVTLREEFLHSILTTSDNYQKLSKLLQMVNENLTLKFVLVKKKDDGVEYNLKRLTEIFGNNLKIKK